MQLTIDHVNPYSTRRASRSAPRIFIWVIFTNPQCDPPSGRWIVDGPNEQQRAAAPVFDRTEKRPVDDHLKRLRDCGGPYTGRRSSRGFGAFLIHRPVSRLKNRRNEEAPGAGLTR